MADTALFLALLGDKVVGLQSKSFRGYSGLPGRKLQQGPPELPAELQPAVPGEVVPEMMEPFAAIAPSEMMAEAPMTAETPMSAEAPITAPGVHETLDLSPELRFWIMPRAPQ